jgi:hypothetical protein
MKISALESDPGAKRLTEGHVLRDGMDTQIAQNFHDIWIRHRLGIERRQDRAWL